ncbi:MAG: recombinase family protein [Bdellovibrionota bacterium]
MLFFTDKRVSVNIQARASRGLYNGGPVPLGYKLIPEKHGYLAIEEDQAQIVRTAFQAFLKEGSISLAAKWLNANGYRYKRQMEGGGTAPRLGHFTATNLHYILRNPSYAGIKVYRDHGEEKEAKAVWEAIIDPDTFQRVQSQLTKNYRRKRPHTETRYPFLIAGIAYAASSLG